MTKTLQILLLLGALVTITECQNLLQGHTLFNTFTDNSTQCNLNVNGVYLPDRIIINTFFSNNSENTPSPIVAPCNYHSFVMSSMFGTESINYTLHLVAASNNPTMVGGYFLASDFQNLNGTACVSLPQTQKPGLSQYLCRVLYDSITIYFAAWGTGNFTFDNSTANSLVFIQNVQNTQNISMLGNQIGSNASFSPIVGNLFDSCGSSGQVRQISSLSSAVTVTTPVNLAANIGGMWLAYTLVKQSANIGLNHTGQYTVVTSPNNSSLFGSPSSGSCWSMGINYNSILPNMDYCAQGCEVSFVLTDERARVYVLQTSGVVTGVNTTNTTNNGVNNGTNSNNNTVVNSGCFLLVKSAFVFISILYLTLN